MRILVPVDGSEVALRALDHAIRRLTAGGGEIRLLNVQPPIPASVGDFVGAGPIRQYHEEEGEKALGPARDRLAGSTVAHAADVRVGPVAETIVRHAEETRCDEIVMGSRGLGGLTSLILGSVAARVLHDAQVPVTVVK